MITDDQITTKAKEEAQRNITDYATHSFQAGFIMGAKWILNELNKNQHGMD
jgi:hypothetical protein